MKDFGDDPWLLREDHYGATQVPVRETLFTVGNGFVGVRGTLDEGVAESGTFINGLHATFPIKYPEDAYGFAHAGQTIVAAPDASQLRVEVSGSALELSEPSVKSYERVLDMRTGLLRRTVEWDSPQGRLLIQTERMVSLARPDLALFEVTVTALEQDVEIVVVSRLARQSDTYIQEELDPRHAECIPGLFTWEAGFVAGTSGSAVGRCVGSGLVASVAVAHVIEGASLQVSNKGSANDVADVVAAVGEDEVTHRITLQIPAHHRVRVIKVVGFSVNVESSDTAVMAAQAAVERGLTCGASGLRAEQQAWLNEFWARSDIAIGGASGAVQQAVHWTLFQLAQASAQVAGHGIAAKGVSGSGYSGHYFWDTEIFVLPFLTYTAPQRARAVLEFRHSLLPAAKHRAAELGHAGALFAWRTINGEEASAYFPAGTAQYHINADVAYSVRQYIAATNDADFLAKSGRELLAQTARFWVDLGFYGADGLFHLHEVTGPDEYSALVDDNVFTNVMARANLNMAADVVGGLEADEWRRAAAAMAVPFDNKKGIHPQDMQFLERAVWDFAGTPKEKYPLLLHFHPLTIYRHQVLKQADLVLALWLLGSEFTMAEKVADFSYYDQLTTGDSTLSAAAQQIVAAEVGKTELAWRYFLQGLSVDLKNAHGNTADGVHVAAAGGVWSMLVCGFGGFRDDGGFRLDPRLPAQWESLIFRLTLPGRRVRAEIRHTTVRLVVEEAVNDLPPLQISVAESVVLLGGLGCDVVVALPEL
ncbi:MAG: glycoside hydrolase family 65 protein [Propionibacteriaceae bacterium]|nr:glycoside hydrolase family 65 protein [Propionibacteriaceae bacterium]